MDMRKYENVTTVFMLMLLVGVTLMELYKPSYFGGMVIGYMIGFLLAKILYVKLLYIYKDYSNRATDLISRILKDLEEEEPKKKTPQKCKHAGCKNFTGGKDYCRWHKK